MNTMVSQNKRSYDHNVIPYSNRPNESKELEIMAFLEFRVQFPHFQPSRIQMATLRMLQGMVTTKDQENQFLLLLENWEERQSPTPLQVVGTNCSQ